MDQDVVKKFLDACHQAKRITELMPKLPAGMTPRHIHVLDALYQLGRMHDAVKISDISDFLNVTRPSITKLLNELEVLGMVQKIPDETDRRVVLLELTEAGGRCYEFYVERYQSWLAEQFGEISPENFLITVDTISRAYKIMSAKRNVPSFDLEKTEVIQDDGIRKKS